MISATTDGSISMGEEYEVHIIAVNTEKDEQPYHEALEDVCTKIGFSPHVSLIIIESTMAPGWVDKFVKPILNDPLSRLDGVLAKAVVVAPRRDWFTLQGMSLETLDRVVGASSKQALNMAVDVLSIVSQRIHRASDYRVAEMVKATENAYRHLGISLAYQLTLAYPELDIREVLQLCSTKWNMDLYFPSIGIGGYCIPMAPQYILDGAKRNCLTLLDEALKTNSAMPKLITEFILQQGLKRVCLLGISYKGNLKVNIASPSIKLAKELINAGVDTYVNDPMYSLDEAEKLDLKYVQFPNLLGFDCVILVCDHCQYQALSKVELLKNLAGCKLILDCVGFWDNLSEDFKRMGISYHLVGDAGWLSKKQS